MPIKKPNSRPLIASCSVLCTLIDATIRIGPPCLFSTSNPRRIPSRSLPSTAAADLNGAPRPGSFVSAMCPVEPGCSLSGTESRRGQRRPCRTIHVICLALELHCGPKWATPSQWQSTLPTNLLLKRRPWAVGYEIQGHRGCESHHPRLMMALDILPSWAMPVTNEGKLLSDWVAHRPYAFGGVAHRPYIFGELEPMPESHIPGPSSDSNSCRSPDSQTPRQRSIKPTVDARLIRKWLDSCNHGAPTHYTSSETLWDGKGLRLIDVQLGCLAHMTERQEYLALSYPWGETARGSLCVTTSNIDLPCQTRSLDIDIVREHQRKTPSRAVLDAMYFTRDTGYRYLWVDALCILQDDADERRRLIHGMGGIYETASCTIICAAGTNADSGLRGVWNTARQRLSYDEPVTLLGNQLGTYSIIMSRPSLDWEVKRSHWNTRGWTYQELCLSSRSLYFTAGEVFFSCFFCHKREGYELSDGSESSQTPSETVAKTSPLWHPFWRDPTAAHSILPSDASYIDFHVYSRTVQEYTKRELTHSPDVINAFQGIFNRFIDPGKTYLTLVHQAQCIPPRFLPFALLWYPMSGSARSSSSRTMGAAPSKFSSWS